LLVFTHFAFVVFLGMLLSLDRDEWLAALTFGVLIDADHLFAMPRYVTDNGWGAVLRPTWDDGSGLPWKSLFHYPIGVFVVAPLSIGWRFFVPLLFWGTHLIIDWFQIETIQYSALIESAFLALVLTGILYLGFRRWDELEPGRGIRAYLYHLKMEFKRVFSRGRSVSNRREDTT